MVVHTVSVGLFAGLAEQVGLRQLTVSWQGGTAAELRTELQERYPHAAMLLSRSSVARTSAVTTMLFLTGLTWP